MHTHVAFLRAINVGGHTVTMDRLRAVLADKPLGLGNVATFIASGNVLFHTSARDLERIERAIEARLKGALGYEVATFVRSIADVAAVAAFTPFPGVTLAPKGPALYIAFLRAAPGAAAVRQLSQLSNELDELRVHGREVYWLCRTSFRDSTFSGALLEKTVGMPATIRNVTTIRKMAARYASA